VRRVDAERRLSAQRQPKRDKRESIDEKRARARKIGALLESAYPEVQCPLIHSNTFELLVAVILSAQCTDAAVNKVMPELFRRFPTPADLAAAPVVEIESVIRRLGLFRAKAKSLKQCAEQLIRKYNAQVPSSMAELTDLAGVGRKTANVILGHGFNLPGIAVDTHCRRVSSRLGLTREDDPLKIETDLSRLFPRSEWTGVSHRLIIHGRRVCHARKPACARCPLATVCPSRFIADSLR
jgi:endonuclease III